MHRNKKDALGVATIQHQFATPHKLETPLTHNYTEINLLTYSMHKLPIIPIKRDNNRSMQETKKKRTTVGKNTWVADL